MIDDAQMRLLALCTLRIEGKSVDWSLLARCALTGHLDSLCEGFIPEETAAARKALPLLRQGLAERPLREHFARVEAELEQASNVEAELVTVLDPEYPENLRTVTDLPPSSFIGGSSTTKPMHAQSRLWEQGTLQTLAFHAPGLLLASSARPATRSHLASLAA